MAGPVGTVGKMAHLVEHDSPRRNRRVAVANLGLALVVAAAAAGALLAVVDREVCGPAWSPPSASAASACATATADGRSPAAVVVLLSAGLASAVVGRFIAARRPGAIGWLLLTFGLSFTVGPTAGAYRLHATASEFGVWPGAGFAGWIELAVFNNPAVFVPFGLAVLLFPAGRTLSKRWSVVTGLFAGGGVLSLFGVMAEPLRGSRWSDGVGGVVLSISDIIEIPSLPLIGIGVIAAAVSLIVRLRRGAGVERAQVQAFLRGVSPLAALVALAPVVFSIEWLWPVWAVAVGVATGFVPVMLGVAILTNDLYGLDRFVNRSVTYTVLTAAIVTAYVVVVSAVGEVAGRNEERVAALVLTALVAIATEPLRRQVQRVVDRMLFGHRSEPHAVAAELARGLEQHAEDGSVLDSLAEATASAMRLPYVEIAAQDPDVEPGFAGTREASDRELLENIDLVHNGKCVGRLSCLPRQHGRGLDRADENALSALAPSIAAAVVATSLAGALARARERLVEAQETEQSRIRRDLHDGLGPALTGIGLGIGELEERADERDRALLARLREEVVTCIADIRRIAHDLQPIALTEHGLIGALQVHAERFSALGLQVDLAVAGDAKIDGTAVERATYRIAAEALTNVHRHANATTCSMRLRLGDHVCLEVIDDGGGIGTLARGVGLRSIEERALELNGRFIIEAPDGGGTRVLVTLPVSP